MTSVSNIHSQIQRRLPAVLGVMTFTGQWLTSGGKSELKIGFHREGSTWFELLCYQ